MRQCAAVGFQLGDATARLDRCGACAARSSKYITAGHCLVVFQQAHWHHAYTPAPLVSFQPLVRANPSLKLGAPAERTSVHKSTRSRARPLAGPVSRGQQFSLRERAHRGQSLRPPLAPPTRVRMCEDLLYKLDLAVLNMFVHWLEACLQPCCVRSIGSGAIHVNCNDVLSPVLLAWVDLCSQILLFSMCPSERQLRKTGFLTWHCDTP